MEKEKIYVVGMAMNPDWDGEDAYMHDSDFENYAYRDYEKAKEAFAQATKAMIGYVMPLDELREKMGPLSKDRKELGIQDGCKAVRFREFDRMPDMEIQHMDETIDLDYYTEEDVIESDGEESE